MAARSRQGRPRRSAIEVQRDAMRLESKRENKAAIRPRPTAPATGPGRELRQLRQLVRDSAADATERAKTMPWWPRVVSGPTWATGWWVFVITVDAAGEVG